MCKIMCESARGVLWLQVLTYGGHNRLVAGVALPQRANASPCLVVLDPGKDVVQKLSPSDLARSAAAFECAYLLPGLVSNGMSRNPAVDC